MTRDIFVVVVVIGLLLGGLWAYSGQPLSQPPIVVVESGSMMHPEAPWGRIGTIDPGDLVLVRHVGDPSTLPTAYGSREHTSYGGYGDVVVFRPFGDEDRIPIIHRILTWVEVMPASDDSNILRYTYHDHAGEIVAGARSVDLPEVGIMGMTPAASGFVTKGDNPLTNHAADQVTHVPGMLVEPEWVIGVSRGQAPWVGLIKLALTGNAQPPMQEGHCKILRAWAPCDSWAMLGVSAGVLILVPLGLETLYKRNQAFRRWAS